MSDPQNPSPQDDENVPEGMEERVRRVRKRRKGDKKKGGGKSVIERGKELLEKMQQRDEGGHVGVAEQVRRLQKDEDEDKPLDEVWGTKRRSTSWLWVSLLGIIVPLIGVGLGLKYLNQERIVDVALDEDLVVELEPADDGVLKEGPLAWFYKDSMKYITEAREILGVLNTAQSASEIEPFVRNSPYREMNPVEPKLDASPMMVENINDITWIPQEIKSAKSDDGLARGILTIKGRRADQSKFAAYFVKEGHQFLLDWDATMGWSEMSLVELKTYRPQKPKEIRCVIEKKARYDREFGGVKHSGYVLAEPETGEFIFAYVHLADEKRKQMDIQLREVLQYGRFLMALKHDEPVIVTVRMGQGGRFEITDFKHAGWVTPELSASLPASPR